MPFLVCAVMISSKFEWISVSWFQSFFKQILLKNKFCEKSNPLNIFKDISLEDLHEEEKFKGLKNIKGSSKFQVIVFEPDKKITASTQLCICHDYQQHDDSCEMF